VVISRVAFAKTAGNSGNSAATSSFTWNAGDLFVVIGGNDDAVNALTTPTFGGGTFSPLMNQIGSGGSNSGARAWSCTPTASGSGAITGDNAGASTDWFIDYCWQFRGHGGTGATSTALTTSLTTSNVNRGFGSWVVHGQFDFSASAAGKTGTPTVTNEVDDALQASHYTGWGGDWSGQSGTVSYGITAGSGARSKITVEILDNDNMAPVRRSPYPPILPL
jgi:hypothetical protein